MDEARRSREQYAEKEDRVAKAIFEATWNARSRIKGDWDYVKAAGQAYDFFAAAKAAIAAIETTAETEQG